MRETLRGAIWATVRPSHARVVQRNSQRGALPQKPTRHPLDLKSSDPRSSGARRGFYCALGRGACPLVRYFGVELARPASGGARLYGLLFARAKRARAFLRGTGAPVSDSATALDSAALAESG